jgi:RNA polymerase sigma factor, sigma-70 family
MGGDERALRRRFAARDEAAIRTLYRRYAGAVFALALRLLADRGHAEEVVQTTFLKAWQAADRLDPDREIGPWLATIARRVAIDLYRRERRHRVGDPPERDIAVLPPSLEDVWEVWQVRVAVDSLPADERDVVRCTHFHGWTHEETADHLGIPVGTVKSRSHRAHRRLARLLAHLEEATA